MNDFRVFFLCITHTSISPVSEQRASIVQLLSFLRDRWRGGMSHEVLENEPDSGPLECCLGFGLSPSLSPPTLVSPRHTPTFVRPTEAAAHTTAISTCSSIQISVLFCTDSLINVLLDFCIIILLWLAVQSPYILNYVTEKEMRLDIAGNLKYIP